MSIGDDDDDCDADDDDDQVLKCNKCFFFTLGKMPYNNPSLWPTQEYLGLTISCRSALS